MFQRSEIEDPERSIPLEESAQPDQDLASRVTLARIRREQDATEMDLLQYLMSRRGHA